MSLRTPSSFGVGEQLFSPQFTVTLCDVAGWDRASVLGDRDDRPGFRPSFEGPLAAGADVPDGLLVAKALEALVHSSQWGGCRLEALTLGRLRQLRRVGPGQRLDAVATVRYRSQRANGSFLTLMVEVRAGSIRVAELEVCIEVLGRPERGPRIADVHSRPDWSPGSRPQSSRSGPRPDWPAAA